MYTINGIKKILSDPDMVWYFKDDEDNVFKHIHDVMKIEGEVKEEETMGAIHDNVFMSHEGTLRIELSTSLEDSNVSAMVLQCKDGLVILTRDKQDLLDFRGNRTEGYWWSEYLPQYPKPQSNVLTEKEAVEIHQLIKEKEKEAKIVSCRGLSHCRFTGDTLGCSEYYTDSWNWPGDFADHYVLKYRVKPSNDFLNYIGYNAKADEKPRMRSAV